MGIIELRPQKGRPIRSEGGGFVAKARNQMRIALGSRSAFIKRIGRGGTHTKRQLGNQLDYLFSKATSVFGSQVEIEPDAISLLPEERKEIVTEWSSEWRGSTKNGQTTHLILSYPADTPYSDALNIAQDWCAEMFEEREHGDDEWAYVAALHTDRANPHVHVIVNNRGLDGSWFYMAKGHDFNYQNMRERYADIAADYGILLDTSTRLERGILTYGVNRAELERAEREGRPVREKPLQGQALKDGLAQITETRGVLRNLIENMRMQNKADLLERFEVAEATLAQGGVIEQQPHRRILARGDVLYHVTTKARAEEIMARGLAADTTTQQKGRGVEAYGSAPVFVAKAGSLALARMRREVGADAVLLQIDGKGLDLVADIPSLVSFGAHLSSREEDGEVRKIMEINSDYPTFAHAFSDMLDAGAVDLDDFLSAGSQSVKRAIELTGTAAVCGRIDSSRIRATTFAQERNTQIDAIKASGDFRQYYSEWFARVEAKIAAKPEAERKALNETFFELVKETTVLLGDKRGVALVDQPARTHLYRNRVNGPDIKTPEATVSIATATSEAITKGMASLGAVIGLDGERLQDRLALGATNAYHEREWIRQDAAQVAKHAGLDLAKRSGQSEVYRRLDMFYRHARDILTATLDRTQDRQRQKENLTRTMERLSKIARDGGDARFASQPEARTFLADLESRYGAGVVGRIMAGDTSALEQDLPKESERAEFGKALVSVARENDLGRDDRELDRAERLHNATLSRIDRDRENGHDQVFDDGFDL